MLRQTQEGQHLKQDILYAEPTFPVHMLVLRAPKPRVAFKVQMMIIAALLVASVIGQIAKYALAQQRCTASSRFLLGLRDEYHNILFVCRPYGVSSAAGVPRCD